MTEKWRIILCSTCLLLLFIGCSSLDHQDLAVSGGDPVIYKGEDLGRVVARYYSLSDRSLNFVKVTMPDGEEYTLPQVVSGSGARYTLEREIVWWVKGDSVLVQTRDENGEWQIEYRLQAVE